MNYIPTFEQFMNESAVKMRMDSPGTAWEMLEFDNKYNEMLTFDSKGKDGGVVIDFAGDSGQSSFHLTKEQVKKLAEHLQKQL